MYIGTTFTVAFTPFKRYADMSLRCDAANAKHVWRRRWMAMGTWRPASSTCSCKRTSGCRPSYTTLRPNTRHVRATKVSDAHLPCHRCCQPCVPVPHTPSNVSDGTDDTLMPALHQKQSTWLFCRCTGYTRDKVYRILHMHSLNLDRSLFYMRQIHGMNFPKGVQKLYGGIKLCTSSLV